MSGQQAKLADLIGKMEALVEDSGDGTGPAYVFNRDEVSVLLKIIKLYRRLDGFVFVSGRGAAVVVFIVVLIVNAERLLDFAREVVVGRPRP